MSLRYNLTVVALLSLFSLSAIAQEQPVNVLAGTKGSTIKIDGRIFGGIFASGKDGAFANRSFDIPDAKLRFSFSPSKYLTIINRFSNAKAATGGFDYFYLEMKDLHGLLPGHSMRMGKVKMDIGQETWSDNPVENVLISNSVSSVTGYDEGVHLFGPILAGDKLNYSIGFFNGTKDFTNSGSGMAAAAKFSSNPITPLYVAASYYTAGELKKDTLALESDMKVGALQKAGTGAKSWKRSLWELDLRWNYGSKGISPAIGGEPKVPFQIAVAYGQFNDEFINGPATLKNRKGSFWFAEGLYNATKKLFVAARMSSIKLDDDVNDKLVGFATSINEYSRLSIGAGYRLSDNVVAKVEGTQNTVKKVPTNFTTDPEINQLSLGLAVKF